MHFNLHTHTKKCNHAIGEEFEYVEHAIKSGIKVLGFSDHAPYCFPKGHYSGFRMKPEETENYFHTIGLLKEKYKGQIKILAGFEAEYYPKLFSNFLKMISGYNPDYLILGQHFTNNEYDGVYSAIPTADEKILELYVSQTIEALNTGLFTYIAHPDLMNFVGSKEKYNKEMKKLCECALKLNVPLEINLLGLEEGRAYPREDFFSLAAQVGNVAILGADAHRPEKVYNPDVISKGKEFAQKCGIKIVESVDLKPVLI